MLPTQERAHRRYGVTMLEILVIVVLVVVLSTLLLPTLADVASVSKQSRCLDHLRRIGYANLVYAAQDPNNNALPVHQKQFTQDPNDPTFIGAYEWGGKSGIGRPGFVGGPLTGPFAFVGAKYGTLAGFGPPRRPLNTILYPGGFPDHLEPVYNREGAFQDTLLDLPEMRCPADTGPPAGAHCPDWLNNPGRSSYDHFGTSYNANIFMTGSFEMWSASPYMHRLADIPNPAETLAYQENAGRWAWAVRESNECLWIGVGVFNEGTLRGWHGKDWMFSAAFIDGHADTIYMNSHRTTRAFEDAQMQEAFRCIIMRGPGWRIDTFPLPRVPTGLLSPPGRPSYEGCVETE